MKHCFYTRCHTLFAILLFIGFTWPIFAQAKLLRVIHTNDLHSFFEHGDSNNTGGYAALKSAIDVERSKAVSQGIDTLVLDGGDFSEGTEFYLANQGVDSWRIMESMGYDAIVLGNHDWLIGPEQMDGILAKVKPKTAFVSANFETPSELKNLHQYIKPYIEIERGGIKIAVVGLSTDEIAYRWRVEDGNIKDPTDTTKKLLPILRGRNDFVFVLSHLGVQADMDLVRNTSGIDLVVGGHSHTTIYSPLQPKDLRKIPVPVVQTGQHGDYFGSMLVDLEPGQPLKMLDYELIAVNRAQSADRKIAEEIALSRSDLEKKYTPEYLYEVVGYSPFALDRPISNPTDWGTFCGEAIRESAAADLSMDIGEFYGNSQPAGAMTRETLIQAYPRVFDVNKPSGWNIWTIHAPGWAILLALEYTIKNGTFLNTSGITYQVVEKYGEPTIRKVRIQGRRLNPLAEYRVAVSEGLGRGAAEISLLLRAFTLPQDTGIPIWHALESKIRSSDIFKLK